MILLRNFIFQFLVLFRILSRHRKFIFLVTLSILVFVLITYYFFIKNVDFFASLISEGVVGTYTEENLPKVVTNLLSKSLIKVDKSGLPQPDLASGFEANKEASKYILTLKQGEYWLDGSVIKAQDFDITIPDVKVHILNDQKISLELADSFSPLPILLNKPVFKRGSLIGTGPYFIDKIEKNQIFIKKITLKSSKKNLPKVIIRFYPNEKIAKNALSIGEVSSLIGLSDVSDLVGQKPFKSASAVNYTRLVTIFYNTKDAILSDRNFRLALSFAAPSIKQEVEAKTSIPPISWAFNADVKDFLDNPDQARVYFNKVKQGKDSTITLTVTTTLQDVGQKIVNEWTKNGIKAVMRVESGIPQNFQALLIAQDIPIDPDQYSLWHSTQNKTNISQYNSLNQYSPRIDKDLEDGRKATDIEVRKAKYQDMQKVLLDDAPATFLYFPKYNVIYFRKVEDSLRKVINLQLSGMQLAFKP